MSRFTDWYGANREEHNEQRRKRYQEDQKYRKQVIERQRAYRQRQKAARNAESNGLATKRRLLTVTDVADEVNRSPVTVRAWEKRGLIPEPRRDDIGTRLYTRRQLGQIRRLAKFIDNNFEDRTKYVERLPRVVESIQRNW